MNPIASTPTHVDNRQLNANELADSLVATRQRRLGLVQAWHSALPTLQVPHSPELNPPLWELGHVGWFQEWWIGRNRQRTLGLACDPDHARLPSHLASADALYNSSQVPHAGRWHLPLPKLADTLAYLAAVQADTLALLQTADDTDTGLYFWRLALAHEAMHNEASVYMAQALNIPIAAELACGNALIRQNTGDTTTDPARQPSMAGGQQRESPAQRAIVPAQTVTLGHSGSGFAFDNELGCQSVWMEAFDIDTAPVTWAQYLPFVQTGHRLPLHVRCVDGAWQQRHFGSWLPRR